MYKVPESVSSSNPKHGEVTRYYGRQWKQMSPERDFCKRDYKNWCHDTGILIVDIQHLVQNYGETLTRHWGRTRDIFSRKDECNMFMICESTIWRRWDCVGTTAELLLENCSIDPFQRFSVDTLILLTSQSFSLQVSTAELFLFSHTGSLSLSLSVLVVCFTSFNSFSSSGR